MKKILALIFLSATIFSCSSSDSGTAGDNYDRAAMLTNWADKIIIPAYTDYQVKVHALDAAANAFTQSPDPSSLVALRTAWLNAYRTYQHVAPFAIGKSEDISFTAMTNTYPADAAGIEANIASGTYSLSQLVQFPREGFPGLDYLINGLAADDASITAKYASGANAAAYCQYLTAVITAMKTNADAILSDWNNGYRDTYVASTGNSVSSAVNKTVNAWVKSIERDIRNAKVGIPAGKLSNGVTYPEKVEAYYQNNISRLLLDDAVESARDFFDGKSYDGTQTGPGLKSYLDYVNATSDGQLMSLVIDSQFAATLTAFSTISDSFSIQVSSDNAAMLVAYNSLQQLVVLTKLDMMQALNITIDYVDGDGD